MTTKVAEMTTDELTSLIETVIDRKLFEWLGDPDAGLELRPEIMASLLRQEKEFAEGKRGKPFEEVVRELGLE